MMKMTDRAGSYLSSSAAGEHYRTFIPHPLPPKPPLQIDAVQYNIMEKAHVALGRLDGLAALLPDKSLILYHSIRKEAILSSQIEGTQSSLSDLLLHESDEAPGVPLEDVQEVSNYIAAINHGMTRLRSGFPISLRLIREIHEILLSKGRGRNKMPGEFRRSQNWIGGTRPGNARFVPPPPEKVMSCMGDLEKFLHLDDIPILTKAALAHVQFETIHPFLDGNGRVGRLLITLILCAENMLSEPLLYTSLYFKTHRQMYYDHLEKVRTNGDWEGWLRFFYEGILEAAEHTANASRSILSLVEKDRQRIESLGRPAITALRLHQLLQKKPIISAPKGAIELGLTRPTVAQALEHLQRLKIVREFTDRARNRLYIYDKYVKIMSADTEPIREV